MRLVLDESVTRAVYDFLRALKDHEIVRSVDTVGSGQPDHEVARLADDKRAIVIESNPKDFRKLIARRPPTGVQKYRHAGRISFCCKASRERQRLQFLMPRIEAEFLRTERETDARLIVEVFDDYFRVDR